MKKNLFSILLIFICLTKYTYSKTTLTCPNTYPNHQHALIRINIFDMIAQKTYDLAPSKQISGTKLHHKKPLNMITQYWDDFAKPRPNITSYVTCLYTHTQRKLTLKIPATTSTCQFHFPYPYPKKMHGLAQFICSTHTLQKKNP